MNMKLRDNALVVLRQNLEKLEQERDDLNLKLEKFQTSSKNLSELLASQTNDKTGLGYNSQVFTRAMFDCDDYLTSESDESLPPSPIYDKYQSGDVYHVVPPPYTGTFMPPKRDLVFHNAPNDVETVHTAFNVKLSPTKPKNDFSHTHRPSHVKTSILAANPKPAIPKTTSNGNCRNRKACFVCKIVPKSKLVPINVARPFTADVLKINVTRPRQNKPIVTKPNTPPRPHINCSPSPKANTFLLKVTAVKAPMVNAANSVQGKWEWKPKCPILDHVSRNTSASMTLKRFDYNDALGRSKSGTCPICLILRSSMVDMLPLVEIQRVVRSLEKMCEKKNSVLFADTKCLVLSPDFKLPDEKQVLLRVPRENNMYNVDLKKIVLSGDLTCLFAKNTPSFIQPIKQVKTLRPSVQLVEISIPATNHKTAILKTKSQGNNRNRKACFVFTAAVLKPHVTRPRQAKTIVTKPYSPPRRHINYSPSPIASNFLRKVTAAKAPMVNVVKGNWEFYQPTPTMAEAVNTTYSIQNRVLVTKPKNKTPYELLLGRTPSIAFMRPFGCPVTILNTLDPLDPLGKFDRKVDEGFLVGYSVSSKAFRVFNSRTRIVQETLHINFLENKPNVVEKEGEDNVQQYVLFLVWSSGSKNPQNTNDDAAFEVEKPEFKGKKLESEVHVSPSISAQTKKHDDKTKREAKGKSPVESSTRYRNLSVEVEDFFDNSINEVNAAGTPVLVVGQISTNNTNTFSAAGPSNAIVNPTHGKSSYVNTSQYLDDPNLPELEDITYSDDEEDVGAEADFTNLETTITVSPIPTTRDHKDHLVTQIIGDLSSSTQTRSMTRVAKDQNGLSQINNDDFHTCMRSYFNSRCRRFWVLVDFPKGKTAICTKWVFRNKKDERGIIVRNKARLVAQGHTQEEGIDYEKVFAPAVRIEAIRLFLAYASFMGFMVYQMNVKSAFLYGTIKEEVYVCQPPGFEDPDYPDKVYKVVKALYGLHQAPRACQDKYVAEILRKFGLTNGKSASTPIDTEKPLRKDPDLAYSDSDYAGVSLNRKSTTRGCQFFGCRLISWQCKRQTNVTTSSTKAEYVAGSSCCAQVL
uniref:Uncharacterized protein n=1 Tax=Tanacetum cinerariifolium TaxID=118510 RepID=A0A6L2M078_TANCI|nr:hypothetical protein [Tanacetum cinerariifolium]